MIRRALIVTSSYAPTMIADMQRARQLAWELPETGWQVEILCPDSSYQHASCIDHDSAGFFSSDTLIHYVPQYFSWLSRFLRLGSIGWRALFPMLVAGKRLLGQREFDVVFISTTQFPLFLLGPAWQKWLGTPYILDVHDPCYRENSVTPMWARPSLRHAFSHWLAKKIESISVPAAAGLVAVSPDYIQALRRRYENRKPYWLGAGRHEVIPFSVLPRDFAEAARKAIASAQLGSGRQIRIVYAGAGGDVMHRSFLLLCNVLAYLKVQDPRAVDRIQFELYGTMLGWRDGDPKHLTEIACEQRIADLVNEDARRVSYRRSVELLLEGDGIFILGVDDAGYMPSKLFSYAAAGKPMLAVLRRDGPAFAQFQKFPELGHAIWFGESGAMPVIDAAREVGDFFRECVAGKKFDRRALLKPYTALCMARRHAELFEVCVNTNA